MSRYCLDTSAYSGFMGGDPAVVHLADRAQWIGMPATTLGELWAGFLLGRRRETNIAQLSEFMAHPIVHEVTTGRDVARIYGEIVVSLRRAGTPLPTNDIWIAAAAAHVGATVLTYDTHFEKIHRVGSIVFPT